MLTNFVYAKSKAMFEERLDNAEVPNDAIVFIEDTKEIWTHGTYFDCSTLDPNVIPNIETELNQLKTTINDSDFISSSELKTINGESIIGTGDITISESGESNIYYVNDVCLSAARSQSGNEYLSTERLNEIASQIKSGKTIAVGEDLGVNYVTANSIYLSTPGDPNTYITICFVDYNGYYLWVLCNDGDGSGYYEDDTMGYNAWITLSDINNVKYKGWDRLNKSTSTVSLSDKILANVTTDVSDLSITYANTPSSAAPIREYRCIFRTGASVGSITVPSGTVWANGNIPTLMPNTNYELDIVGWYHSSTKYYHATLVKFS